MGLILIGILTFYVIVMFETVTVNNDSEYYVLKEAMNAAMLDSIDQGYYTDVENNFWCTDKKTGENKLVSSVKINEQKFVEAFTRRFAASTRNYSAYYTIDFYDVIEMPPKATVVINSDTKSFKAVSEDINILNNLTGILETDCYNSL